LFGCTCYCCCFIYSVEPWVVIGAEQHWGFPVNVYLQYWDSVHESHDRFLIQVSASLAQDGMGFSVIGVTAAIWISAEGIAGVVGILPILRWQQRATPSLV